MYRTIEDFISDWNAEAAFTLKVFSKITEEIKTFTANNQTRTVEILSWHITKTLTEMPSKGGLMEADLLDSLPPPTTFDEIIELYKTYSDELIKNVSEKWTDADLLENISIYGEQWEKRKLLSVLVKHQTHHRGQLTTLMRMQNIEVPATYGPSKEDWAKFGMEIHE